MVYLLKMGGSFHGDFLIILTSRSSTQTAYGDGLAQGFAVASACAPPLPVQKTPDARKAAEKAAQAMGGGCE
jgi:hypothetical protein